MSRSNGITVFTCLGLSALLWHARICHSFVTPRPRGLVCGLPRTCSSNTQHNMLEEDDGDEDNKNRMDFDGANQDQQQEIRFILEEDDGDEDNKNQTDFDGANQDQQQEIRFILQGPMGEDDGDEDNKNRTDFDGANQDQQQEIRFILQGPMGKDDGDEDNKNRMDFSIGGSAPKSTSEMIAEWKEQLLQASPTPLTTIRKVRLEKEIDLLEKLTTSDQGAEHLVGLWVAERGQDAEKALEVAAGLVQKGHPILWAHAEALLLEVIQEEGPQFVAPLQLLASLYALQGRVQESKELNEMVLMQKPWHIGALAGAHNDCKALNDYMGLVKWDHDRMPSLGEPTRAEWAQRMADKARLALKEAEKGPQEIGHHTLGSEGRIVLEEESGDDAWQ